MLKRHINESFKIIFNFKFKSIFKKLIQKFNELLNRTDKRIISKDS